MDKAIVGYSLLPVHWRLGYGEEAARMAVGQAFQTTDLTHIAASVWHDNAASLELLIKLGFVESGRTVEMSLARKVDTELVHLVLGVPIGRCTTQLLEPLPAILYRLPIS